MYKGFFGLKETPFSIAPNPDYLYMSERHKEALAHLTFGLHETGGFVLLTGEVGTGKTTVSRCLLEQIPAQTTVAFILNPTLTEHELLASICDEFDINYDKKQSSIKDLTDAIKHYLLANHQAGKNALLIIDEAQHLRAEVLEQLRLLTNLETNTKKLLQVILIGQPELQALLKRQELRQLAQRITARYHLLPLSLDQVAAYIKHRLQVAGCQRALFTKGAVKRIHQISHGIPRVINLLCDRALMGAYVKHQDKIDVKIVEQAASEALDYQVKPTGIRQYLTLNNKVIWLLVLACFFFVIVMQIIPFYIKQTENIDKNQPSQTNETLGSSPNISMEVPVAAEELVKGNKQSANDDLTDINRFAVDRENLSHAFGLLAAQWRVASNNGWQSPCVEVAELDLACHSFSGSFNQLVSLNIPALLELYQTNGQVIYGVLKNQEDQFVVQFSDRTIPINQAWLSQYWRGKGLVIWQPPSWFSGKIDHQSDSIQLQWLENQLSALLFLPRKKVEQFDRQLQAKLNRFQNEHKLAITPYADTETLILIQQLTLAANPRLQRG